TAPPTFSDGPHPAHPVASTAACSFSGGDSGGGGGGGGGGSHHGELPGEFVSRFGPCFGGAFGNIARGSRRIAAANAAAAPSSSHAPVSETMLFSASPKWSVAVSAVFFFS